MEVYIAFDTLEYMKQLNEAGIENRQAEAITKATHNAIYQVMTQSNLCTKNDLKEMENLFKSYISKTFAKYLSITVSILSVVQLVINIMSK